MSMSRPIRTTKNLVLLTSGVLFVLFLLTSGVYLLAQNTNSTFLPNTRVAGLPIGKLSAQEAATILNTAIETRTQKGIKLTANGSEVLLSKDLLSGDTADISDDLLHPQVDQTLHDLFVSTHPSSWFIRGLHVARAAVLPHDVLLQVSVNADGLDTLLHEQLSKNEQAVTEPAFLWNTQTKSFSVTPGVAGKRYATAPVIAAIQSQFAHLIAETISVETTVAEPTVTNAQATTLAAQATALLAQGLPNFTYASTTKTASTSTIAALLVPILRQGQPTLGVASSSLASLIDAIGDGITQPAQDARFTIQNGKVDAFQKSQDGLAIDADALRSALETTWIAEHAFTIPLTMQVSHPTVTTESANSLGIKELLGTGYSTYKGSPVNRIKNIKNSLKKLNGILIAPDEEFSLISKLQPFTLEGGYLPEKVIKGDQIKPEIGGGACQIGSTTFRAAMNSGLPITMRQNHSLVVSYYNDLKNNNPGTDATIYDPLPDFRFKNDTGHSLLLLTEMDEKKMLLSFSFWGTSDGRAGSYTAPQVSKWYPPGEKRYIESKDAAPGSVECQHAFQGADASFTYTVTKADHTKEDRVFTSHYRPLPEICVVGPGYTTSSPPTASSTPIQ